ncbi:hypothetical protein [Ralstonia sp. SET104]|uniref:hypothetical protein n=1 Tax=Ralstonia sp. SET104 TaxID=2448774 RepID=UPI001626F17A|nr:hypothetical protein [Ralstonia sp. SET104]
MTGWLLAFVVPILHGRIGVRLLNAFPQATVPIGSTNDCFPTRRYGWGWDLPSRWQPRQTKRCLLRNCAPNRYERRAGGCTFHDEDHVGPVELIIVVLRICAGRQADGISLNVRPLRKHSFSDR